MPPKVASTACQQIIAMAENKSRLEGLKAAVEHGLKRFREAMDAEQTRTTEYFLKFDQAISNEDLTGTLIRGHLYAESEMARILQNAAPLYQKIPTRQLMFEAKVAWLRALALISGEERRALEKLNELRNSVAHITKAGVVPELKIEKIGELQAALSPTMLELFDRQEWEVPEPAAVLRASLIAIVIVLYIRSEATRGEFGVADIARYHLSGDTVQQRIETAQQKGEDDAADLKAVKNAIQKLKYEDRDALRTWMREVYHY